MGKTLKNKRDLRLYIAAIDKCFFYPLRGLLRGFDNRAWAIQVTDNLHVRNIRDSIKGGAQRH